MDFLGDPRDFGVACEKFYLNNTCQSDSSNEPNEGVGNRVVLEWDICQKPEKFPKGGIWEMKA